MKYSGTMDPECIKLCDAINLIDGVQTVESCCGHGEKPYRIWFMLTDWENGDTILPEVLYWFDACHSGTYKWKVIARTDCVKSEPSFMIEGPMGEEAYKEAEMIAQYIMEDQDELDEEDEEETDE